MGTGADGLKTRVTGATGPRKKFDDIFSRVDKIHQLDGRTDRHMDKHRTTAKTALTHSVVRVKHDQAVTYKKIGESESKDCCMHAEINS